MNNQRIVVVLIVIALGLVAMGALAKTQRIADYDLAITELQSRILRLESKFEFHWQENNKLIFECLPGNVYSCMQKGK